MVSQSKGTEQSDNRQVNKVGTVTSGTESELYVLLSLILSPFSQLVFVSQSCGLMKLPLGLRKQHCRDHYGNRGSYFL